MVKYWKICICQCEQQVLYVHSLESQKEGIFFLWQSVSCPLKATSWQYMAGTNPFLGASTNIFQSCDMNLNWNMMSCNSYYAFPSCCKKCANSFCSQTYENSLERESMELPEPGSRREPSGRSQSEGRENERPTFRLWKRAASQSKVIQLVDPEYAN